MKKGLTGKNSEEIYIHTPKCMRKVNTIFCLFLKAGFKLFRLKDRKHRTCITKI